MQNNTEKKKQKQDGRKRVLFIVTWEFSFAGNFNGVIFKKPKG